MLNLQGQSGSHSVKGLMGATPCCHTQLTPVMWPFGSAVRVLDTALRSRRSAALLVTPPSIHPSLPPSTSISTSTSAPKPLDHKRREREDRPSASAIVNRGTPSPPTHPQTDFPLSQGDPISLRRCVPLISAAHSRAVPLCSGPVLLPSGGQFIPWKLDELLESCEQVREES